MSQPTATVLPSDSAIAERLLARIGGELLELPPDFGIDADLFEAGLDSMTIMQVILIIEQEFAAQLPDQLIKRETFSTVRQIAAAVAGAR